MIDAWIFEFFPEPSSGTGPQPSNNFGRYFSEYVDLWSRAEALGFKGIFFSEHHFGGSFSPSPNLLIAAVAQRTKVMRLGVMGVVTPFYSPTRIAEEIGMLDQLSGGRLEIGTAVGIPQELARANLSMADAREFNDEAIQFLDLALTGQPVTFRGKHFQCENLRVLPPPLQQPFPPKWTTVVSPESARKAAKRRSKICTGFNPTLRIKEIFDGYRDEADRCGFKASAADLALRRRVVVAGSRDEAADLVAVIDRRMREMLAQDPRAKLPPKAPQDGRSNAVPDASGGGFVLSDDEYIQGTPEIVAEQIIEQCRLIGAANFLAVLNWGSSLDEVRHGHQLFAEEIIPSLKRANVQ
jgi:alkanesulfonate monooxygenase SsuD/methylene tetrahydromethanopterin reductase-like flavin-dependent oxidoreductase (luciferase family)